MSLSRRRFLRGGAAVAGLAAIAPRLGRASSQTVSQAAPQTAQLLGGAADWTSPYANESAYLVDQDDVRKLALEAIDAAKDAGAEYAEVRLTRTTTQRVYTGSTILRGGLGDSLYIGVGVRALYKNAWGFASSSIWQMKEMSALAKSAVEQAKANSIGSKQTIEFKKLSPITGTWSTPIRVDPFSIPIEERIDFMTSWMEYADNVRRGVSHGVTQMSFQRQERALATSDGTFVTQTLYNTSGNFPINVVSTDWRRPNSMSVSAGKLVESGKGWELFLDANIPVQMPALIAEADELLRLPTRGVTVGRYDIVLDAAAMGELLNGTIASAIDLDRAIGNEANAGGTSYLRQPLSLLGMYRIAAPSVTISANRSAPAGLATVKWDDEGIEPDEFNVVQDGILNDYPTTREQVAILAPWYTKQNRPLRSHGCSSSDSALHFPIQHAPNFVMQPSAGDTTFDSLVKDTRKGLAIFGGGTSMDYQIRTGIGTGARVREIVDGKLGALVANAAYQVNMNSFWRSLVAYGGAASAEQGAYAQYKGEPVQLCRHSITSVPGKFRNAAVMDITRTS